MPGMTGLDVLREVKNRNQDIVVIMVTAVPDAKSVRDALELGAYDYVVKPLSMDELLVAVERALDRRRLILENRDCRTNLEGKSRRPGRAPAAKGTRADSSQYPVSTSSQPTIRT